MIVQPSTTINDDKYSINPKPNPNQSHLDMPSATVFITFVVMALFYNLSVAAPPAASFPATLLDNFNSTDTGVSMVAMGTDPNDIFHVPDLNTDVYNNKQRCYYWGKSEKWQDVGGKHSQFVQESVYHMCEVIAAYTTSAGFKKDDTVSDNEPDQPTSRLTSADH